MLDFASACAERLTVSHDIVDIRTVGRNPSGSALADDVDIPDGH